MYDKCACTRVLTRTHVNTINYPSVFPPNPVQDAAADEANVQVMGGMCGTVGPVGFALGGGHGALMRGLGLGTDNIVSARVVLANGSMVEVSDEAVAKDDSLEVSVLRDDNS